MYFAKCSASISGVGSSTALLDPVSESSGSGVVLIAGILSAKIQTTQHCTGSLQMSDNISIHYAPSGSEPARTARCFLFSNQRPHSSSNLCAPRETIYYGAYGKLYGQSSRLRLKQQDSHSTRSFGIRLRVVHLREPPFFKAPDSKHSAHTSYHSTIESLRLGFRIVFYMRPRTFNLFL